MTTPTRYPMHQWHDGRYRSYPPVLSVICEDAPDPKAPCHVGYEWDGVLIRCIFCEQRVYDLWGSWYTETDYLISETP